MISPTLNQTAVALVAMLAEVAWHGRELVSAWDAAKLAQAIPDTPEAGIRRDRMVVRLLDDLACADDLPTPKQVAETAGALIHLMQALQQSALRQCANERAFADAEALADTFDMDGGEHPNTGIGFADDEAPPF